MNLRKVTIWTTGVLSLGIVCIPLVCFGIAEPSKWVNSWFIFLLGWSCYAWPLAISWLVARRLKHAVPLTILLVATVYCGIKYTHVIYIILFYPDSHCCQLLTTFMSSLIILIPVWFFVLRLNSHYIKNTPEPEKIQSGDAL